MRLSLHTIICCCVFTTVMSPVNGDTEEPRTAVKNRLRKWLQNNTTSEPDNSLVTTKEPKSDAFVGESSNEEETPTLPPRCRVNIRYKRSSSKPSGCFLITCLYHDLIDKLSRLSKKTKMVCAPQSKIGSNGYGRRRRRSLVDVAQLALQTGIEDKIKHAGAMEGRGGSLLS